VKVKGLTRLQRLFWTPVALVLGFLGAASVSVARGRRVSLDGRRLARHLMALLAIGAFLYISLFLWPGRLLYALSYTQGSILLPLIVNFLFLAMVAIVALVIYGAIKELSFKRGLR